MLVGFQVDADDMEVFVPSREFGKAVNALGNISKIELSNNDGIILFGENTKVKIPMATEILSLVASIRGKSTANKKQVDASFLKTVIPIIGKNTINPFPAIFLGNGHAFTTDGVIIIAMPCEWCNFDFAIPYSHADKLSLLLDQEAIIDIELLNKQMLISSYADDGSYATVVIPEGTVAPPPALRWIEMVPDTGATISTQQFNRAISKLVAFTSAQSIHMISTPNGVLLLSASNDKSEITTEIPLESEGPVDARLFSMYAKLVAPKTSEWVRFADSDKALMSRSSNGATIICAKLTR